MANGLDSHHTPNLALRTEVLESIVPHSKAATE
eukprot:CAMPEP_0170552650 /NCGR_PEP_ID=MMETSP0211-20121228/10525_1 /TAXON_ID=311385 /ORGANISM="Pseudokeronopsis sp., Strain OXSARD2" /LENGTH=32 /DNA_ID= /DNA_START= /DNA_END= /DNA_ORIENTATION=